MTDNKSNLVSAGRKMDLRTEPVVTFLGNDRFPRQIGKKICIDWSSGKIRMSLILHAHLQRSTQRDKYGYRPKEEVGVIHLPLNSELVKFETE